MKDNDVIRMAVCPLCGRAYYGAPAGYLSAVK